MDESVVTDFRQNGYALSPRLLGDPLLARLRAEADRLVRRFTDGGHRSDDYWYFERAVSRDLVLYRIHKLQRQGSAAINDLFADGLLHALARDVLGVPAKSTVCAMIVKMPRVAARVPWHRDRTSVPPHTVCNLSLFLDDSTTANGCLEFVPRSHLSPAEVDGDEVLQRGPVRAVPAQAGDVLIHDVRVVHGSRTNETESFRRSIVVEFAPVGLDLADSEG